jgi:import inner membrane translocase subunit TIM50
MIRAAWRSVVGGLPRGGARPQGWQQQQQLLLRAMPLTTAGRGATAAVRRFCSGGAAKPAVPRKAGGKGGGGGAGKAGGKNDAARGRAVFTGLGVGSVAIAWLAISDDDVASGARGALFAVPGVSDAATFLTVNVQEMASPWTKPVRDKLLSDWPPPMVPPETPQPMVLVVDLEDTLVKSTWDRRYGWRHAKRPGVDRFLEQMSKSYEIVIFTSNMFGIADPVVSNLDTKGYVLHRLFRDACWYKDGVYVKDLSKLNRDERRIVIIDDDPQAYSMQPNNAVPIAPYEDPTDKGDSALMDLVPFLEALVVEDARTRHRGDTRNVLGNYRKQSEAQGGRSYADIYNEKLVMHQMSKAQAKEKGLGGWARGAGTVKPKPGQQVVAAELKAQAQQIKVK